MTDAPCRGAIAICSRGELGLITSETKVPVNYPDGSSGFAWTGVHLRADVIGAPWSSREPVVLGAFAEVYTAKGDAVRRLREILGV